MMTKAKNKDGKEQLPATEQQPSGGLSLPALDKTPDRAGDEGVGQVATDPVSDHDAEVQAIVNQALAEQQEVHDEELREVTEATRSPNVPGKPQTRPMALGSSQRIKVRAVTLGYYNHKRQRPGDVFWIKNDAAFSDAHRTDGRLSGWMERVPIATPERTTTAPEALRQETGRIRRESGPAIAEDQPTGGVDVMTKP